MNKTRPKTCKEMMSFVEKHKKEIFPNNKKTTLENITSYIKKDLGFQLNPADLKNDFLAYSIPAAKSIILNENFEVKDDDKVFIYAHEIYHIFFKEQRPLKTHTLFPSKDDRVEYEDADLFAYFLLKDENKICIRKNVKTYMEEFIEKK